MPGLGAVEEGEGEPTNRQSGSGIAHISHLTTATTSSGVLLAWKTLNFSPFWPFLAILSRIYALFGAPFLQA